MLAFFRTSFRVVVAVVLLLVVLVVGIIIEGCYRSDRRMNAQSILATAKSMDLVITDEAASGHISASGQGWWITDGPRDRNTFIRLVWNSEEMRGPRWKGIAILRQQDETFPLDPRKFAADVIIDMGSVFILGDPEMLTHLSKAITSQP
jgi:hypothetical protein